jgi:hypothetical protein
VIEEDKVKQVCEQEYRELEEVSKKYNLSMNELARAIRYHNEIDVEGGSDEVFYAYDQLLKKFKQETDLTLDLGYHDSNDSGDRYDELDGYFFAVNFSEVYELTPVGRKAKEQGIDICVKSYVSYG